MNKRILVIICFISVLVVSFAAINDGLFHAGSYGTQFIDSRTSLSYTFKKVNTISWAAVSNMSGNTIICRFKISGLETDTETFSLSSPYSMKTGSIGNVNSISDYTISGEVSCTNPSGGISMGYIAFDAFTIVPN